MNRARPSVVTVNLATLVEIYGERERLPEMTIPVSRFDERPDPGGEVLVEDAAGDTVRAKVVRLVAVVQPDFDTYEAAALRGQEELPT